MEVSISCRGTRLTPRLEEFVEQKIGRLDRYLSGLDHAEVHFAEEKNPRIAEKEVCEVTLEGHGHHVRTKVSAVDEFAAVEIAASKLEHQLRKLKSKLDDRHHGAGHRRPEPLPPPEPIGPRIVKQKRFMIDPMTPEEASLRIDLVDHGFFFFTNSLSGRAAVLYRRDDGDFGLIDEAG